MLDDQLLLADTLALISAFGVLVGVIDATRSIAISAFAAVSVGATVALIARTVLRATDDDGRPSQPATLAKPQRTTSRITPPPPRRAGARAATSTPTRDRRHSTRDGSARSLKHPHGRHEPTRGDTVVVGYDGSASARAAVSKAGRGAGEHGQVFVVHAYPEPPGYLGYPYYDHRLSNARRDGTTILSELLSERRDELPQTDYVAELLGGPPAEAINNVAKARNADAILIGSHTTRRLRRRLRGSVSHKLERIANRPVLIVPAPTAPTEPSPHHPTTRKNQPAGWPNADYLEPPWS